MKVEEIRKILLDEYGQDASEVKGKAKLVEMLEEAKQISNDQIVDNISLEDFEPMADLAEEQVDKENDNEVYDMIDPKWSDFVMTHFEDDELIDGNPTVDGLRRVTEVLIGPIIGNEVQVIQPPNPDNGHRAVTVYTLTIFWERDDVGENRTFSDAADVYQGNTEDVYARFPTATACTRAEGRVLRKILRLKKVVAAEELTSKPVEEAGFNGLITNSQKNFITTLCKKLDLNIKKFISSGKEKYDDVDDIRYETAKEMIRHLNKLQQNVKLITPDLKGYEQ